jgi:hypothetical protein
MRIRHLVLPGKRIGPREVKMPRARPKTRSRAHPKRRGPPAHLNGHRPIKDANAFYAKVLEAAKDSHVPFLVGGAWAINAYTGLTRDTKDVDIFCRAEDYPRLLTFCAKAGYQTVVEDERWIAKVCKGPFFCDVIFGSANAVAPVNSSWFEQVCTAKVLGVSVRLLPPTELLWSKALIMDRVRYDGSDVAHLIFHQHEHIDWRRLLSHMTQFWEVLLSHVLLFRFIYPHKRRAIPEWLLDHLLDNLAAQRAMPPPQKHVCRGRIFSRDDYQTDITTWGLADLIGEDRS